MSEGEFWLRSFRNGFILAGVIVVCSVASCQMTNIKIVDMVEAGASPIEARCSLNSDGTNTILCLLALQERGE